MGSAILALHGLGGTGAVWDGFIDAAPANATVIAPDLAGHGAAPGLPIYRPAALADELVDRLGPDLLAGAVVVVGHSLGGAVGLELAGRHPDLPVTAAIALGVKVVWTPDDLAGMQRLAAKPATWFDEETTALDRHRRVTGLEGDERFTDRQARRGIVEEGGRWRLAIDPAAYLAGGIDVVALIDAARCPVHLLRGEHDAMAPEDDLVPYGPVTTLAGAGHNAHVDQPGRLWAAMSALVPWATR